MHTIRTYTIHAYINHYNMQLLQFDGTVYTFGFGSDHSANMLEAISTQGGGVYYYIDSNEKVGEYEYTGDALFG